MSAATVTGARPSPAPAGGPAPGRGAPAGGGRGRPAPAPRAWVDAVGTALVALATAGAVLALGHLLLPGSWRTVTWLVLLLAAGAVAATRAAAGRRARWLPTVVGAAVLLVTLVVRYGGSPTLGAAGTAREVAREGTRAIQVGVVPLESVPGTELLVVAGAAAVLLLADTLAVALRLPAMAALPLVTLWVPTVVLAVPAPGSALWAAGMPWLLLLAWDRGREDRRAGLARGQDLGRRAQGAAVSALVVVALAALATPLAAGGLSALPGWARLDVPDLGTQPVGPLTLSDDLDLRESLGARSQQEVLRYTLTATEGAEDGTAAPPDLAAAVGPLRAFTLAEYDGRSWERTDAQALQEVPAEPFGSSGGDVPQRAVVEVAVTVNLLDERRLPITTTPRLLDVPAGWEYDVARDEVVNDRPTRDGMRYRMVAVVPELSPDDLARAEAVVPPDATEDYLQLPQTEHLEDVRALAAELTAEAGTPYARAAALQTFFRSAAEFTYDTRVSDATSEDAVWDFLRSRRGYCVQFATAMTVMARTLGIPARMGVGFLPGQAVGESTRRVTGQQAHTWPELYFEGYGWVRFEPTPAVQTGSAPSWTTPASSGGAEPQPDQAEPSAAAPGTQPSASASASTGASATASAGPGAGPGGAQGWLLPAGVLAVLGLLAGTVALVGRRRRPVMDSPDAVWAALVDDLRRAGVSVPVATTPRAAPGAVGGALAERGWDPLDAPAAAALGDLAAAVERHRYAPGEQVGVPPDRLREQAALVVAGVRASAAAARTSRPART
ncbi:DUF3488 and transglutaminase-like domain-containing protein [Cellulomonas marina]|uniref:Transglutaminase-like superfamily protein n=1 Tax=Cellulomonas marina TaxID=988821 RepID=A0A1I0VL51_9CELL|nr:DUF3488 and transglutaminase-like domain-containing protein [Cellulomonas marina]GIG27914.1 hypothetical protein Cma02nite_05140 [Cellulomonas marina]SFA76753.1 Transglutaminase-like superfamily protein [Cellulomonas marina]